MATIEHRDPTSAEIKSISESKLIENNERKHIRTTHDDVITKALGIKRCLTYDEEPQGAAKQIIDELCHRFGNRIVVIKKHEVTKKLYSISLFGRRTDLTFFQVVMWKLFKWPPKGTILDE